MTGPLKAARSHVRSCPDWARLYRESPEEALEPGPEYERWLAQDRADERAREIRHAIAEVDEYRARQAERFRRPPDILEE